MFLSLTKLSLCLIIIVMAKYKLTIALNERFVIRVKRQD